MYDMSPQHIRDVWMSVEDTRPALRMREIRFMYENMWFKQAYFQKDLVISDGYCVVPKDDLIRMCFYSRLFGIDDSFDHDRCGWAIQFGDVTYSIGRGATAIEWLMKYTYISDNYEIKTRWGSNVRVIHPICNDGVGTWAALEPFIEQKEDDSGAKVNNKDIVSWLMED